MKAVKYNIEFAVSLIPSSEPKFSFLNEAKFITQPILSCFNPQYQ